MLQFKNRKFTSYNISFLFLDEVDSFKQEFYDIFMQLTVPLLASNFTPSLKKIFVATSPSHCRPLKTILKYIKENKTNKDLLLELLLITDWQYKTLFNRHHAEFFLKGNLFTTEEKLSAGFGLYTKLTNADN